jgi:hypothetical protein
MTEDGVMDKLTVLEAYMAGRLALPSGYDLEFDADIILLRKDDATVAAFGVAAATPSEVTKTAWEDYTRGYNSSA